jgi:hypothetical protein
VTATAMSSDTEQVATATIPAQRGMTSSPRPRAVSDLTLAATSTAANVGVLFLQYTLEEWGRPDVVSNGKALLSEMITQAVTLTGVPNPSPRWADLDNLTLLHVRLMLFEQEVVIQVADRHRKPPTPSPFFRALSKRWHFYPTPVGRVVSCALDLPQLTEHGLPKRKPPPVPRERPPRSVVDRELLQRVLKGLEDL